MMRETLTRLGYSESNVEGYADAVRRDHYDLSISTDAEQQALEQILGEEKRSEPITDGGGGMDTDSDGYESRMQTCKQMRSSKTAESADPAPRNSAITSTASMKGTSKEEKWGSRCRSRDATSKASLTRGRLSREPIRD